MERSGMGNGQGVEDRLASLESRVRYLEWKQAQTGEIKHWQDSAIETHAFKQDPESVTQRYRTKSAEIMKNLGILPFDDRNKLIIDIGCGPTGRCSCFCNSRLVGIDPLADQYRSIPWAQLDIYADIYPYPAETDFDHLHGRADLVVCINALDHCAEPSKVIQNAVAYLKPSGLFLLSVDCDSHGDEMHPAAGEMEKTKIDDMLGKAGLREVRHWLGDCMTDHITGEMRHNWGGGIARHWICRKA